MKNRKTLILTGEGLKPLSQREEFNESVKNDIITEERTVSGINNFSIFFSC